MYRKQHVRWQCKAQPTVVTRQNGFGRKKTGCPSPQAFPSLTKGGSPINAAGIKRPRLDFSPIQELFLTHCSFDNLKLSWPVAEAADGIFAYAHGRRSRLFQAARFLRVFLTTGCFPAGSGLRKTKIEFEGRRSHGNPSFRYC